MRPLRSSPSKLLLSLTSLSGWSTTSGTPPISPIANVHPDNMAPSPSSNLDSVFAFEGPEKRLFVTFASNASCVNLRNVLQEDNIQHILATASCKVLSVCRNTHFDAFLLSESSLFVADDRIMLKTCGTTTLLRALPIIIEAAAARNIVPDIITYSRVRFQHPELQPWPHTSFVDEVNYLDNTLRTHGASLQIGRGDWQAYVAKLNEQTKAPTSTVHTLEIFMFDLDPSAMRHFVSAGTNLEITSKQSGITSLIPDGAIVDEFNFEPCGYSLNAVHEFSYITIHVSPEPEASYVSFESTANSDCLAHTISAVVKLFRPSKFTVSFVGSEDCKAFVKCQNSPVDWLKLSKLLGGEFEIANDATTVRTSSSLWASTAKYSRFEGIKKLYRPTWFERESSVLSEISNKFNVVAVDAMDEVTKARAAMSTKDEMEHPMFIIDVKKLLRCAERIRSMIPDSYALRYTVRCNSDMAVLMVLKSLGWSFETVSAAEVELLHSIGVEKKRIVFSSPIISRAVIACIKNIGTISLFCVPDSELIEAIKAAGVGIEVRVPTGAVGDTVELCKSIIDYVGSIESFALDCSTDERYVGKITSFEWFTDALDTVKKVKQRLPAVAVKNARLAVGDLCALENRNILTHISSEIGAGAIISPGRWVVGPCVSIIVSIVGLRLRNDEVYSYYMNDGVYGAFGFVGMGRTDELEAPEIVTKKIELENCSDDGTSAASMELFHSVLFGPTCDAIDRVWSGALPRLEVGDSLVFRGMGAYAASTTTLFNGFAEGFDTIYVAGVDDCGILEIASDNTSE